MALDSKKNLSRFKLLNWICEECSTKNIKRIEDLRTGAEFCTLMHKLYPDTIRLNKIKYNAKCEHEFVSNYKLLQSAFNKKNILKEIPVEGLIKGRITDNFEFLKWFKDFYDRNKSEINRSTGSLGSNNNLNSNNNFNGGSVHIGTLKRNQNIERNYVNLKRNESPSSTTS